MTGRRNKSEVNNMEPNKDGYSWVCPECGLELEHSNGIGTMPPYLYCPTCMDVAYDANTGTKIGRVE
jgi:predicted RNA-binding Zn-ribbon protein involved in translation (DUF1610 family)